MGHWLKLLAFHAGDLRSDDKRVVLAGFVQVLEILESPSISRNHFPGLESPGILMQVLESPANLNWATFFAPNVFNQVEHSLTCRCELSVFLIKYIWVIFSIATDLDGVTNKLFL